MEVITRLQGMAGQNLVTSEPIHRMLPITQLSVNLRHICLNDPYEVTRGGWA